MLAAARPAGAAGDKRTGIYVLETYYLQQGAQVPRMHDYFSKVALPAIQRARHAGPDHPPEEARAPGGGHRGGSGEHAGLHRVAGPASSRRACCSPWDT